MAVRVEIGDLKGSGEWKFFYSRPMTGSDDIQYC